MFLPYLNIYTYSNKYLFWFIQNKKTSVLLTFIARGSVLLQLFNVQLGQWKKQKQWLFFQYQNLRLFHSHNPNHITWAIDSLKYIPTSSEK